MSSTMGSEKGGVQECVGALTLTSLLLTTVLIESEHHRNERHVASYCKKGLRGRHSPGSGSPQGAQVAQVSWTTPDRHSGTSVSGMQWAPVLEAREDP